MTMQAKFNMQVQVRRRLDAAMTDYEAGTKRVLNTRQNTRVIIK